MEKKVFLATWKDIPAQNEIQFSMEGTDCNAGELKKTTNNFGQKSA
jgi:hypothetical protein